MQDQQLIEKFKAGDEQAFDTLFKKYQMIVLNTCYRLLQDDTDSQDAAQEIFIKVYRALPKFKPDAQFTTWLYRICINHCYNVLRARKRKKLTSIFSKNDQNENSLLEKIEDTNNPMQDMEKKELKEMVIYAVNQLPKNQRTAVILHRFEGLSYKEIADVMNTTVSSVESRLHRAKLALAKNLSNYIN